MDTISAFAMGEANRHNPPMVFDWHKAAKLIRDKKPKLAMAGLRDDWEWTGGPIFTEGQPVPRENTYTYLRSTWAVPELNLDGEIIECFVMSSERPEWNANTYWPQSALDILEGKEPRS
jgi:hypothetical protein